MRRGVGAEGSITATAPVYHGTTLYARAPWLFPLICVLGLAVLLAGPVRQRAGAAST